MLEAAPEAREIGHGVIAEAIDALNEASLVATQCADACLVTDADMTECVQACLDTADVAGVTARVLARTGPTVQGTRGLVDAAARILSECTNVCGEHAEHHRHCRICAEACDRALQAIAGLQTKVAAAVAE